MKPEVIAMLESHAFPSDGDAAEFAADEPLDQGLLTIGTCLRSPVSRKRRNPGFRSGQLHSGEFQACWRRI